MLHCCQCQDVVSQRFGGHDVHVDVESRVGVGFGKMSGFPRAPDFSKPGFKSLVENGGKFRQKREKIS